MGKMKKIINLAFLLFVLFLLIGCDIDGNDEEECYVRFQNATDLSINYGIKYGEAEHIGQVPSGSVTSYYSITPGTYSVQARDVNGNWVTISAGSIICESDYHYSLTLTGIVPDILFYLVIDY